MNPIIDPDGTVRRSGISTRPIDSYIQELFVLGKISVKDHIDNEHCHRLLFERVWSRLKNEHGLLISEGFIVDNYIARTIELKNKEEA